MKKVLFVTTLSRTINAFLVPHINMLIDSGCKVDCACNIDPKVDYGLAEKGVNFYNIPFSRKPLDPKNIYAFMELMTIQKKNKYDIIHVHTPIASFYGRLLKLKFKYIRIIYTVHGFHFYKGAPLLNWIIYYPVERIMAKLTDVIITINSEDYERALKFKIPETYKVNGVGVDLNVYNSCRFDVKSIRKSLGVREDDFLVLMVAEVNANKNHKQLIEAMDILKKKGIRIKAICAGDGPLLNKIKKEINDRKLNEYIKMLGYRNDVDELIAACDIGILLSYREGLPRNIMEFMAKNKKVIVTNIRGNRDLIIDKRMGTFVEVGDYAATARAMEGYCINDFSEDIKPKEIEPYNVEKVLKNMKEIYSNLM